MAPNVFHFTIVEVTVVPLRALEMDLYPCPDPRLTTIALQRSTESSLKFMACFCSDMQSENNSKSCLLESLC